MTQDITIPLSWANNIPGVSGVRDVTFTLLEVPQGFDEFTDVVPFRDTLEDLLEEIDDQQDPGENPLTTLGQAIAAEFVQEVLDDLVDEIETALPQVDFPEVELFAQEFIEALTDLDGFFGPIEDDFRNALQDVLGDPDLPVQGIEEEVRDALLSALDDTLDIDVPFGEAIEDILTTVEDVLTEVEGLDVLTFPDLIAGAEEGARNALDDVLPDWLTQPLEDTVSDLLNGLLEDAIDDNTKNKIEDFPP